MTTRPPVRMGAMKVAAIAPFSCTARRRREGQVPSPAAMRKGGCGWAKRLGVGKHGTRSAHLA